MKAASDQSEGVSSGVILSWRRRNKGEAAEKVEGIAWYRDVGSQMDDGAMREGSSRRLFISPRGG